MSKVDTSLADLANQPSETQISMSLIGTIKKLNEKIKSKTTELEKAKGELMLSDKDEKYKRYLLEQKSRLFNANEKKLETLDDRLDGKEERIERDIERLQDKKEDLLRKINQIDEMIERLKHKEKEAKRKIEHQKQLTDAERQNKLTYYDDELKRLQDGVKSTPKIRSLEVDLIDLWEQLNRAETQMFGEPCSIKGWKRELPDSLKESKEPTLEVAAQKEPEKPKSKRSMKTVEVPIQETIEETSDTSTVETMSVNMSSMLRSPSPSPQQKFPTIIGNTKRQLKVSA